MQRVVIRRDNGSCINNLVTLNIKRNQALIVFISGGIVVNDRHKHNLKYILFKLYENLDYDNSTMSNNSPDRT